MGEKTRSEKGENGDSNKLTKHHIIPKSRGGGNGENVKYLPENFHISFHKIFGNMLIDEVIEFIEIVFLDKRKRRKKKTWRINELYALQLKIQQKSIAEGKRCKKK